MVQPCKSWTNGHTVIYLQLLGHCSGGLCCPVLSTCSSPHYHKGQQARTHLRNRSCKMDHTPFTVFCLEKSCSLWLLLMSCCFMKRRHWRRRCNWRALDSFLSDRKIFDSQTMLSWWTSASLMVLDQRFSVSLQTAGSKAQSRMTWRGDYPFWESLIGVALAHWQQRWQRQELQSYQQHCHTIWLVVPTEGVKTVWRCYLSAASLLCMVGELGAEWEPAVLERHRRGWATFAA